MAKTLCVVARGLLARRPEWLARLPAVDVLRVILMQNYP